MSGLTALENVMMPLELFNLDQPKQRAEQALESVGLSHRLHHRPQSLSGGEQQRVAIARALVTQPKILFADEPTGNLDETTANQVQDLLFQLQDHTTLILVTHDVDYAARCQRQVRLEHGQLIEDTACR
jgi:putative ABC transport system ATP-binding protein